MMAQKLQEKYSKGRVTESHAKPTESSKSIAVLSSKFQNVLEDTLTFVEKCLTRHNVHLQNSAWKSIPELTNSDGKVGFLMVFLGILCCYRRINSPFKKNNCSYCLFKKYIIIFNFHLIY